MRERVGTPEEEVVLPPGIGTVRDLTAWLAGRGEHYAETFTDTAVRCAVDRVHARPDASIQDAEEVAFFPPMTGG